MFSSEFPAVASLWTNQNIRSSDFNAFHEFTKCLKHFKGTQKDGSEWSDSLVEFGNSQCVVKYASYFTIR
ncbi:hypothetical protein HNY73_022930 [Argiope bruennichi]|uniref:Uncharacterized protein n=1 Tax=Argiope bruennichi TaxID=94029 RepID=A0A8T0E269_ARGBR|nr:hypothetical protein HNY73_022930 [Argiope bruennichi]